MMRAVLHHLLSHLWMLRGSNPWGSLTLNCDLGFPPWKYAGYSCPQCSVNSLLCALEWECLGPLRGKLSGLFGLHGAVLFKRPWEPPLGCLDISHMGIRVPIAWWEELYLSLASCRTNSFLSPTTPQWGPGGTPRNAQTPRSPNAGQLALPNKYKHQLPSIQSAW